MNVSIRLRSVDFDQVDVRSWSDAVPTYIEGQSEVHAIATVASQSGTVEVPLSFVLTPDVAGPIREALCAAARARLADLGEAISS